MISLLALDNTLILQSTNYFLQQILQVNTTFKNQCPIIVRNIGVWSLIIKTHGDLIPPS